MPRTTKYVECLGPHGFYRVAYHEWSGPAGARTIICAHGLTRNGRDFDALAAALQDRYNVICPDFAGRGESAWLPPQVDYTNNVYLAGMTTLIARLNIEDLAWIGTSMGGMIGMLLAGLPGTPIRRLVVNDIGARVRAQGLRRIAFYAGARLVFAKIEKLEAYLRTDCASYGPLTDAQWRHLAEHGARTRPDGRLEFNYDPRVVGSVKEIKSDVDLSPIWSAIRCPTLVLRGEQSDVLGREDAFAMIRRGPPARLVEFAGIGHAPTLMAQDQIETIRGFLAEG